MALVFSFPYDLAAVVPPLLSRLKPDAKERKMRGWIAVMKEWEVGS